MGLPRATRVEMQDDDHGDADTDVYAQTRAEGGHKRAERYHNSPACSRIKLSNDPDGYTGMTRQAAWHRWLAPCSVCVLDGGPAETQPATDGGLDAVGQDLKRVAADLDRAPSWGDYQLHGEYSTGSVYARWDTWAEALDAVGLERDKPAAARDVTPADAERDLKRVRDELGRIPSTAEYREHGTHATRTVRRKFDPGPEADADADIAGWPTVLEAVFGHDLPRGAVTPSDAEADLRRLADELGRIPTTTDYRRNGGRHALETLREKLGPDGVSEWATVLQAVFGPAAESGAVLDQ